jgi:hypothetical protein
MGNCVEGRVDPGDSAQAIAGSITSDKIGAYRRHAIFPLTIWHDGFIRTNSFASAASGLLLVTGEVQKRRPVWPVAVELTLHPA